MGMGSDEALRELDKNKRHLVIAAAVLTVVSLLVIVVGFCLTDEKRILGSYGLLLDVIGVGLVSYTVILPLRKKIKKGTQFIGNDSTYRAALVIGHADKHASKLQIGVVLLVVGFVMQIWSVWC